MTNYKEKALYHIKRKMNDKYIIREVEGERRTLELIFFKDRNSDYLKSVAIFPNWGNCYKWLKFFTKTTKRKWLEKNLSIVKSYIFDTDLEPHEQETIKDIQEIYDYKYSSLDIAELSEMLSDLTDDSLKDSIKNLIYSLEYIYNKETIEIE